MHGDRLEERKLTRERGHHVPVQGRLRRVRRHRPPRARTGGQLAVLPCTRRVVTGEPPGDDSDLPAALGAVSATRGHEVSVHRGTDSGGGIAPTCARGRAGGLSLRGAGASRARLTGAHLGDGAGRTGSPAGIFRAPPTGRDPLLPHGCPASAGRRVIQVEKATGRATRHDAPVTRHDKTPSALRCRSSEGVFPSVAALGFEPRKAEPADLQSAPFGHSGTPPGMLQVARLSASLPGNDVNNT